MKEQVDAVIGGLSALIMSNLQGAASQQYFPSGNADFSDETIKLGKERATVLRKMRDDFENLVSGVL